MLPKTQLLLLLSSVFLLSTVSVMQNRTPRAGRRFKNYEDYFLSQVEETASRPTRCTRSTLKYEDDGLEEGSTPQDHPRAKKEICKLMSANKERRKKQMGNSGIKKSRFSTATKTTAYVNTQSQDDVIATQDPTGRITSVSHRWQSLIQTFPAAPVTAATQPAKPVHNPVGPDRQPEPSLRECKIFFRTLVLRMDNIHVINDTFEMTDMNNVPLLLWMPSRSDISVRLTNIRT